MTSWLIGFARRLAGVLLMVPVGLVVAAAGFVLILVTVLAALATGRDYTEQIILNPPMGVADEPAVPGHGRGR